MNNDKFNRKACNASFMAKFCFEIEDQVGQPFGSLSELFLRFKDYYVLRGEGKSIRDSWQASDPDRQTDDEGKAL